MPIRIPNNLPATGILEKERIFVMTEGPCGAVKSVLIYVAGLCISYVCSFIITSIFYNERELLPEEDETIAGRAACAACGQTGQAGRPI